MKKHAKKRGASTKAKVIAALICLLFIMAFTRYFFNMTSFGLVVEEEVWNSCDDISSVAQGRWLFSEGTRLEGETLSSLSLDTVTDSEGTQATALTEITVLNITTPPTPEPTTPLKIEGTVMSNDKGVVMLRGFGRLHDVDDPAGWWAASGESFLANREQSNMSIVRDKIVENLVAMRSWGANMLRIHIAYDWWWQNTVNPSVDIGAEHPNVNISYRAYLKTLIQEAQLQGVYIVICPYYVKAYSDNGNTAPPIPSLIPDEQLAVVNGIYSGDATLLESWRRWWTSIGSELGIYDNVLFETWNEPMWDWQTPRAKVVAEWNEFSIEAYKTVRSVTNNVLIFAFDGGTVPGFDDELQDIPVFCDQLEGELGQAPTNISFDFHAYRFTWNLGWATDYATLRTQLMSSKFIGAVRSRNLHVGCYEMGGSTSNVNQTTEYDWFYNFLKICNEEKIPYNAYFWAPRIGLSPSLNLIDGGASDWWLEGQIAPTPTVYGQAFIDLAKKFSILSPSAEAPGVPTEPQPEGPAVVSELPSEALLLVLVLLGGGTLGLAILTKRR